MIDRFEGKYEFLRNDYPCNIEFEYNIYPSVEHAFQAAKTNDIQIRIQIRQATAMDAKKIGRSLQVPLDWDSKRIEVMTKLIDKKFESSFGLRLKILMTGCQDLVQGGMFKDDFWGLNKSGKGQNMLGVLLMDYRQTLFDFGYTAKSYLKEHFNSLGLDNLFQDLAKDFDDNLDPIKSITDNDIDDRSDADIVPARLTPLREIVVLDGYR